MEIPDYSRSSLTAKVNQHLKTAREAAESRKWWSFLIGHPASSVDRLISNIHKAEVGLLQLAPTNELKWYGTVVLAWARQHLGTADPRLSALEKRLTNDELGEEFRELAVDTLLAAHDAEEAERARVRSFRNILVSSAVAMTIIVIAFAFWSFLKPGQLPENLCFNPEMDGKKQHVCPLGATADGWDVISVEVLGLGAAALAGAIAVRNIQGTTSSHSVPLMLIILRLPIGALAALLGILLIHGEFIPGLTDLDTGPQILAWAIAFGILQESVTHLVDKQGNRILESVKGSTRGLANE